MNGKIYRTRASTAAIATALLLATPLLLLITPALAVPVIILSPTSGSPGTTVTISGTGFAASASGVVWFDSDGDSVLDPGEPNAPVTTDGSGDFSGVSLIVPDVTAGSYLILADIPLGPPAPEASASFTVPTPSISISPTSGPPGTSITVVGSNFKLSSTVTIFFDLDSDGQVDPGETVGTATAGSSGAFSTIVSAPTLPSGSYSVRATDGVNTALGVTFTITPAISLSPTSGSPGTTVTVSGSGFAASASGVVWFDSNNNGALDSGEPSASVTASATGTFTATLTVPTVAAGTYNIRADVPSGGTVEASASFTVPTPSISISPTSGPPTTPITVTGSGFNVGASGVVWFDSNNNGALDSGEPSASVTASATGTFTATLTVPTVAAGTYNIRADVPSGGTVEASATFTVTSAISLSPTSGPPGTSITVTGSGFAASASGAVWFDSDGDSVLDPGEPSASVSTGPLGTFTATLTVPTVAAGTYNIRADVPSGGTVEASATFTVLIPSITVSPTSGPPGTSISVSGTNFIPGASGSVWFDLDGDSILDAGEPSVSVTASGTGTFTATLTVPTVAAGTYNIRADVPSAGSVEASATFAVTFAITLSPTSGSPGTTVTISGSGFAASVSGVVWFDTDNDNVVDAVEPSVSVTASATGTFTATLTVPTVAAGTYYIKADVPSGGGPEAAASFTVLIASITVSPTTVSSGQLITITGTGFTPAASGFVWFDIDGDGVLDPGEPQVAVSVTATGTFATTLTTPDVPAGTYNIRADIPPGPPLEDSAPIIVAAPGFAAIMAAISEVSAKLGTFGPGESVKSLLDAIEAKLDPGGAFYTFVNNMFTTINNKLGTFSGSDTVASLLYDIKTAVTSLDLTPVISAINSVSAKLGTFSGSDTVASLLYDIKTAMVGVKAGDVVASKAETDKTTTSATPYVISGFPANKAFRGTLTLEINTALGSGVFLAVQIWDGDSWATVWKSATGAPAGTAVSIDIAGLTDGSGNAVRIVTNAATARQFDYVFVYHIDL
jgi:hypothetical protein